MNFIPLAVVEGLELELQAMHPELDIVLRALINAPEGLQAYTTYIVSSVLRAQRREEGFQEGVVQGRMEGVAMGRAAAWADIRNDVEDEVVNEGVEEGRVEDVGEGAAREMRVRERDDVLAAANKRRRTQ